MLFSKIADAPRTASGALRNEWVEIGFEALCSAVVSSWASYNIARLAALRHAAIRPATLPVTKLLAERLTQQADDHD